MGMVPDAVQGKLLRFPIPPFEEMISASKLGDIQVKKIDSDEFQKEKLMEELISTEKRYVGDLDIIIKVSHNFLL